PALPGGRAGEDPLALQGGGDHRSRLLAGRAVLQRRGGDGSARRLVPGGEPAFGAGVHLRPGRPRGDAPRREEDDRKRVCRRGRQAAACDAVDRRAGVRGKIMAINERELAELVNLHSTQRLDPFKGVKKLPIQEYFTSGHRTCQGCESALVMKMMVKAAGPRTIVLGSTGCMYVANTTYYSTAWVVPLMHTQLGSAGSGALGTSAGLKALMKKGKMKAEPIN